VLPPWALYTDRVIKHDSKDALEKERLGKPNEIKKGGEKKPTACTEGKFILFIS